MTHLGPVILTYFLGVCFGVPFEVVLGVKQSRAFFSKTSGIFDNIISSKLYQFPVFWNLGNSGAMIFRNNSGSKISGLSFTRLLLCLLRVTLNLITYNLGPSQTIGLSGKKKIFISGMLLGWLPLPGRKQLLEDASEQLKGTILFLENHLLYQLQLGLSFFLSLQTLVILEFKLQTKKHPCQSSLHNILHNAQIQIKSIPVVWDFCKSRKKKQPHA